MIRKIIKIDETLCNGCGICVEACHEGAIELAQGKARLIRDDYCDGLMDCLPTCPVGAISLEERDAAPYDEAAVKARQLKKEGRLACGCKSDTVQRLAPKAVTCEAGDVASQLSQWPVQIQLAPVQASFFEAAHILIAADCTAYAFGDFHRRLMKGKITLIGCPKLDHEDYSDKLAEIFKNHSIQSVTVARMQVPCCRGIETFVKTAIEKCGKDIPCETLIITTDGGIIES